MSHEWNLVVAVEGLSRAVGGCVETRTSSSPLLREGGGGRRQAKKRQQFTARLPTQARCGGPVCCDGVVRMSGSIGVSSRVWCVGVQLRVGKGKQPRSGDLPAPGTRKAQSKPISHTYVILPPRPQQQQEGKQTQKKLVFLLSIGVKVGEGGSRQDKNRRILHAHATQQSHSLCVSLWLAHTPASALVPQTTCLACGSCCCVVVVSAMPPLCSPSPLDPPHPTRLP